MEIIAEEDEDKNLSVHFLLDSTGSQGGLLISRRKCPVLLCLYMLSGLVQVSQILPLSLVSQCFAGGLLLLQVR